MAFEDEITSFEAYAQAMPNNSLFLVDTYDTLQGVNRAVEVGRKLRAAGHELVGVRLDSGDLAYLSIEARKILDAAGFPEAAILASNDLDEYIISSLKQQGAKINVWGVGTRLVTAWDQPALGGVYKLGAIRNESGKWEYRVKVSEQTAKITIPGMLQVRRFEDKTQFLGDMIHDELHPLDSKSRTIVDPLDPYRRKAFPADARNRDLLEPVFRGGKLVYTIPTLLQSRERAATELGWLHSTIKRLINPHVYPVGLERSLHDRRFDLIMDAKGMAA
jgi:nicotinate phosphoribosyltransferase